MIGGKFLKESADLDLRMSAATNDEQLSDICRDIEARLVAESADPDDWVEYEAVRDIHLRRIYGGVVAG